MTRLRLTSIVAIALVVLAGPVAPARSQETSEPGRPITLQEATDRALRTNEGILIERASLSSAESAVKGAKGAYDPFLSAVGAYRRATLPANTAFLGATPGELAPTTKTFDATLGVQQLLPTGGLVTFRAAGSRGETDGTFEPLSPAYGTQVGLEYRQPLLRNLSVDVARLNISTAESDREGAAASLHREVSDTIGAVERAYWRLAAVRLAVNVLEESVRLAEEQLEETRIRIEGGAAPEAEIAQPRAELERRRGDLFGARETLVRADNDLKILIFGENDKEMWSEPLVPADEVEIEGVRVDVAAEMERALASRPEVAAASATVERRKSEAAFAGDTVRPSLDAVLSYDRLGLSGRRNPGAVDINGQPLPIPPPLEGGWGTSFDRLGDGSFDDARVAVVLGVPLGNRSARAASAIAREAQKQAEIDLARVRKSIRAEVLDAAAAIQTAEQRIDATRAAREAAEVQLSSEKDRYGVGLSTNFLVLTRQNDLSQAKLDEIRALTDHRTALTDMARATGSLLEERGIQFEDAGSSPEGR